MIAAEADANLFGSFIFPPRADTLKRIFGARMVVEGLDVLIGILIY